MSQVRKAAATPDGRKRRYHIVAIEQPDELIKLEPFAGSPGAADHCPQMGRAPAGNVRPAA
jgi:hypothetical protein